MYVIFSDKKALDDTKDRSISLQQRLNMLKNNSNVYLLIIIYL
jgi:hypothetical protein